MEDKKKPQMTSLLSPFSFLLPNHCGQIQWAGAMGRKSFPNVAKRKVACLSVSGLWSWWLNGWFLQHLSQTTWVPFVVLKRRRFRSFLSCCCVARLVFKHCKCPTSRLKLGGVKIQHERIMCCWAVSYGTCSTCDVMAAGPFISTDLSRIWAGL